MSINEISMKNIGSKIKKIRKSKHLKQHELAEIIGISTKYMSNIETGSNPCSLPVFIKIINTLNISADYILSENLTIISEQTDETEELNKIIKHLNKKQQNFLLNFIKMLDTYNLS